MIVGGVEEIRLDEGAREMYVADNYLGGRVMVYRINPTVTTTVDHRVCCGDWIGASQLCNSKCGQRSR